MNFAFYNLALTIAALLPAERMIPVCMETQSHGMTIRRAQAITTQMFAAVGVRIEWHGLYGSCALVGDQAILIELAEPGPHYTPGTLGNALAFGEPRIHIFYERVRSAFATEENFPFLLAHVLAHEIAHILERSDQHSGTGIMKAH